MKDTGDEEADTHVGLHGQKPALQVICLGNSGGPSEENVTAFLVRSIGSDWAKGSLLAVDAGSHLAPITRILERDFPNISRGRCSNTSHASNGTRPTAAAATSGLPVEVDVLPTPLPTVLTTGPFAGLKLPNESARANALHVLRTYVSTYLITHPHLDHLSGFAINTAAFNGTSRPKTLAALPSTVSAIKQHIFNDVIWPNLTDEDGGVGFVTFQRLKEGGDVMMGEGESRGYIDVCDGLAARAFKVSHGVCTKSPPSHLHRGSITGLSDSAPPYNGSIQGIPQDPAALYRSLSIPAVQSQPGTPGSQRQSFNALNPSPQLRATDQDACVVDSTAYFLRDEETQREVIIFGDVEPDSLSLTPRNYVVWQEAARKIAQGVLGAIFIECSYDDSQADAILFGHLNPKHLIAELQTLASLVVDAKAARAAEKPGTKRKRSVQSQWLNGVDPFARLSIPENVSKRSRSLVNRTLLDERRRSSAPDHTLPADSSTHVANSGSPASVSTDALNHYHFQTPEPNPMDRASENTASPRSVTFPRSMDGSTSISAVVGGMDGPTTSGNDEPPLRGIKVIIIHVKDTFKDGPHVSESILAQLQDHEYDLQENGPGLGCEFIISKSGESYWI